MIVVFIAIFVLLFVVEYIARLKKGCEINKSLEICKLGTAETAVLVLLLIAGGIVVVIGVTAYILLTSQTQAEEKGE